MARKKPKPKLAGRSASERLSDELFGLVQYHQGKAFISDGTGILSVSEIVELAMRSLEHTLTTAELLRGFIEKHKGKLKHKKARARED